MADTTLVADPLASEPRAAFRPNARPPSFSQDDVDDAYARGFLAGTEEAQAELAHASSLIAERIATAREALINELRRIDAARRDEIVDFAFEVARWLVQGEITTDPRRVLDRIAAALPDRADDLVVRVAPAVVAIVSGALPGISVAADAALGLADIRLAGADAQLDGTIDTALVRLRQYLETDDDGAIR